MRNSCCGMCSVFGHAEFRERERQGIQARKTVIRAVRGEIAAELADFLTVCGQWDTALAVVEAVPRPREAGSRDLSTVESVWTFLAAADTERVEEFEPAHLGQLEFYLEALDRDVKKLHERPSIGVLLCATKDREVVEYALSRALSPALVAEYQTRLPDKRLLQAKLHEFYELAAAAATPLPVPGKPKRGVR